MKGPYNILSLLIYLHSLLTLTYMNKYRKFDIQDLVANLDRTSDKVGIEDRSCIGCQSKFLFFSQLPYLLMVVYVTIDQYVLCLYG